MNTESADSPPRDQFFSAMGHVAEPVWVVTTYDHNDDPTGFTATSVTSLSADPPSLVTCINRDNEGTPAYSIDTETAAHVLTSGQEHIGNRFAGMEDVSGKEKFAGDVQWHREEGFPVIEDVCLRMTGVIDQIYDGYTHNITVIKVTDIMTSDRPPLLYWNGEYVNL